MDPNTDRWGSSKKTIITRKTTSYLNKTLSTADKQLIANRNDRQTDGQSERPANRNMAPKTPTFKIVPPQNLYHTLDLSNC